MANRRMKPGRVLSLIRKHARANNLVVRELPGRGKGSHRIFTLIDSNGKEVARFGLTGHPGKEMSRTVLRQLEDGLKDLFGEKWMEQQ